MNAITDKTYVIVLRGNVKIYVNAADFEKLKAAVGMGVEMLEVEGRIIMRNAIQYIVPAADLQKQEKEQMHRKHGDWQCFKGNWHDRKYTDCSC